VRTESLITQAVPSNLHVIPVYRPTHVTGKVPNVELRACRNTGNGRVVLTPFKAGACRGGTRRRGNPLKDIKVSFQGSFDEMRTHKVRRSRVDLEGKVLVIAADLHSNRVDAKSPHINEHTT
jgi:hypothetical protein